MKTYRDLDVYQRAYRLALELHRFSLNLPAKLQFDLADQLRRASRSIPSNIAEGSGRNKSNLDKINFVSTAIGSVDEVKFNLQFLSDAGLIGQDDFEKWLREYEVCGRQLFSLLKHLKRNP